MRNPTFAQATPFELLDDTGGVGHTLDSAFFLPSATIGNPKGKPVPADPDCCCGCCLSAGCLEGSGGALASPSGTFDGNGGVGSSIFA
jgi:hypothetical protein